ncbi:MAG: nuclear transport factor 2 family protein [Acidobacteria bacterium]|nr:nuclear transport factor 2 family protein [Acidobacteriota bacterium]MBI3423598.1 nuclear transport factor 2 family protein [Acidobacteriota bacterium]
MIAKSTLLFASFVGLLFALAAIPVTAAEPAPSTAGDTSTVGLDRLRSAVKEAYNRGDTAALTRYLHPDVVIIFPDGAVLKGRQALLDYYERMLKAPGHRVASFTADPIVESRTVHNDVGLSYGQMNDQYVLTDGKRFGLNSRFTITVFKTPDGPTDTDGWMIRSFHASTDAFDNPVLLLVSQHVLWTSGLIGLVIGAILGLLAGAAFFRRKPQQA